MALYTGFIGTYTKKESRGIYRFKLDTTLGKIIQIGLAAEISNPTYLTISHDNRHLYSVIKEGPSGGIAAYSIDSKTEALTALNRQLSEGAPPCYVSVGSEKRNVFSANYHKGTIESYLLNDEGYILPPASIIEHHGSGPDPRQEKPHTHYSALTPDERFVIAVELGSDRLYTYEAGDGVLKEKNRLSLRPGSGPRHIVFHPNMKYAYVMTEFSSEVIVLSYNQEEGNFSEIQSLSTLPEDFRSNNQGSAIHISSDGRFVYAGNRGHNSIAVFKVNEGGHGLQVIEHTPSEGNWPRDFTLDPLGKFMVVANQESDNLVLFSRDTESGKLTLLQSDITVHEPVCVKFLNKNML